ncbi:hypothetical protein RZS08_20425, partial [Arthrospira platensis SPKY1]|nr:hypothetical protein [Arthrospira platensis SPKY1]
VIREAQAKGEKLEAEAVAKRLETLHKAAQAAQLLAGTTQLMPVADALLSSAGFTDANAQPALQSEPALQAQPDAAQPTPQLPQ